MSAALVADLAALSDALDQPGVDLEILVRQLNDNCVLTVDSYLGFTLTLFVGDDPFQVTVLEHLLDPSEIRASARLPLMDLSLPASTIVFYARQPGAFVDLAADLSFAMGLTLNGVELDGHLIPPDPGAGIAGLSEIKVRNQAIGILMARGYLAEDGLAELRRIALRDQISLTAAAESLVTSLKIERTVDDG